MGGSCGGVGGVRRVQNTACVCVRACLRARARVWCVYVGGGGECARVCARACVRVCVCACVCVSSLYRVLLALPTTLFDCTAQIKDRENVN